MGRTMVFHGIASCVALLCFITLCSNTAALTIKNFLAAERLYSFLINVTTRTFLCILCAILVSFVNHFGHKEHKEP